MGSAFFCPAKKIPTAPRIRENAAKTVRVINVLAHHHHLVQKAQSVVLLQQGICANQERAAQDQVTPHYVTNHINIEPCMKVLTTVHLSPCGVC